jgi:hypothetical protein
MNLFSQQDPFLDRKVLSKNIKNYQEEIIEQIKSIDTTNIKEEGDFKPRTEIIEKQRIYLWIRVYLREEDKVLQPGDDISIRYIPSGEILETKFICYNKSVLTQNQDPNIINYNTEDDRKVLCLMVDLDRINKNSEDIPFIRTLFKIGRYYEYQILKRGELELVIKKNGEILDYFDIDF